MIIEEIHFCIRNKIAITQFSKPTGSQAACGLKYCYVDTRTGALRRKNYEKNVIGLCFYPFYCSEEFC